MSLLHFSNSMPGVETYKYDKPCLKFDLPHISQGGLGAWRKRETPLLCITNPEVITS